jgi:hypothetical protein
MGREYLGGCLAAQKAFGFVSDCCMSCHVDNEEFGQSICYIDTDAGYYEVCCAVKQVYDNTRRDK